MFEERNERWKKKHRNFAQETLHKVYNENRTEIVGGVVEVSGGSKQTGKILEKRADVWWGIDEDKTEKELWRF